MIGLGGIAEQKVLQSDWPNCATTSQGIYFAIHGLCRQGVGAGN